MDSPESSRTRIVSPFCTSTTNPFCGKSVRMQAAAGMRADHGFDGASVADGATAVGAVGVTEREAVVGEIVGEGDGGAVGVPARKVSSRAAIAVSAPGAPVDGRRSRGGLSLRRTEQTPGDGHDGAQHHEDTTAYQKTERILRRTDRGAWASAVSVRRRDGGTLRALNLHPRSFLERTPKAERHRCT